MSLFHSIKEQAGVLLKDSGRYRRALSANRRAANGDPLWLHLCNRNESLEENPQGPGVYCPWRWTSDLHACKVNPAYGRRLAERAFADWPIEFADQPRDDAAPRVSFIVAHEGHARLNHVLWTVRSILAQRHVSVECLVIDQSADPVFGNSLPAAVQHVHRPRPEGLTGWRKSWALNQGARLASGEILVFHDGDIVCPAGYAQALLAQMKDAGAASIQRFLFNLNQGDTQRLFDSGSWPENFQPERIRQNWEGGTIAVRREAFFELGGYDEAFVGWGGEDNEFFNRCRAVGHLTYGFVPFVHLWHQSQPDKHRSDNPNITHALDDRIRMPAAQRMAELQQRRFGDAQQPDPLTGYRDAD
ncbi:MAG: galactosyltransferase-related protein [Fuerstiella sp.]